MTLVETLVAVALGVVIVGLVAGVSTQIQSAIATSQANMLAVAEIRAAYSDLEQDLANITRADAPNPPFAGEHPLMLQTLGALGAQTNDPTGLVRYGDSLRVFASIYATDPTTLAMTKKQALIEYALDPGSGFSSNTPGTNAPSFVPLPGNGISVSRLRRRILKQASIAPPPPPATLSLDTLSTSLDAFPVFVNNVVSFQVEWVDPRTTDVNPAAGFQAPTSTTATGAQFSLTGSVYINNGANTASTTAPSSSDETADSVSGSADTLLTYIPVGGEITLSNSDFTGPTKYLVRSKVPPASPTAPTPPITYTRVLLNDHVYVERQPSNPKNPVTATAFLPPGMIRVSIIVAVGLGPNAGTARFSRVFSIAH
jgi:hypothetical protein